MNSESRAGAGMVMVLANRKPDREPRAMAGLALDIDPSAMLLHDRIRHLQAESGPLPDGLGREERLEHPLQVLRGNAASGILDADPHLLAVGSGGNRDGAVGVD